METEVEVAAEVEVAGVEAVAEARWWASRPAPSRWSVATPAPAPAPSSPPAPRLLAASPLLRGLRTRWASDLARSRLRRPCGGLGRRGRRRRQAHHDEPVARDGAPEAAHRHGACPQVRGLAGRPEQRVAVARERAVHRPPHLHRLAGRTGAGVESQLDGLVDLDRQRAGVGREPGDAGQPRRRHAHVPAVHRPPAAVAPRDGDDVRPDVRRRRREGPRRAAAGGSTVQRPLRALAGAGWGHEVDVVADRQLELPLRRRGLAVPGDVRRDRYRALVRPGERNASCRDERGQRGESPEPQHAGRAFPNRMRVATRRAVAPRRCQGAGTGWSNGPLPRIFPGVIPLRAVLPVLMFLLATVARGHAQCQPDVIGSCGP